MKVAIIVFIIYVVVKESLNVYSLIKYKMTFGKAPKKFEGSNWVLVFYILQCIFNVIYGIVFWRFLDLLESDFDNTFYHSTQIWIFIIIMNVLNWKRKKLDEKYVIEDESNYT